MQKKKYWKDIGQSFISSKGRFLSIFGLMAIGSLALVGLKVTTPDMNQTAQAYIDRYNMADLVVMADYGLSNEDLSELNRIKNATVEYGYLTDVTIKNSKDAIRVFSNSSVVSKYNLVSGRIPLASDEIALASGMSDKYKVGDSISFTQTNANVLKTNTFKVTGFVKSSEIWSENSMGTSTAGYGELTGYGVTVQSSFNSDTYMIARISYNDLNHISYNSHSYTKVVNQHKKDLDKRLEDNGTNRLEQLRAAAQAKIDQSYADIAISEKQLADAAQQLPDTQNQEIISKQSQIATTKARLENEQAQLNSMEKPVYRTYTRSTMPGSDGYVTYSSSTQSVSAVGNIFPLVLYLVAAMVTFTTMTRFVDEERNNAGIFKALGYTKGQIIAKFIIYGLVASLLGSLVGILVGNLVLSPMISSIISSTTVIGGTKLFFYPSWILLTIALSLVSAVLPAYMVARKELIEEPAQLFLAKPPVSGSKIFLERLTFIWKHLSFTQKVTARNIFRYKQRMLMTIFGVAGSVALLFAGLGIQSSISGVANSQFGDILKYHMIVSENSRASETDKKKLASTLGSSSVEASLAIQYTTISQSIPGLADNQLISLLVTDSSKFSDFVSLRDRSSRESLDLTNSGAIVSEKLAKLYDVKLGDNINLTINNESIKVRVAGISEMYAGHFVYMTKSYYEKITKTTYSANAYLVTLENGSIENIKTISADLIGMDAVSTVVQNISLIKQLKTVSSSLNSVMVILIVLSVLLAIVILYNLTNINVAERIRELSTIKVLGFHNKEVTMYIYRETIILSLIGIISGLVGGYVLHQVILHMIGSNAIMFNPNVEFYVFLIPVFAIIGILSLLGWLVNHTLKGIDMLEALKSIE